MGIGGSIFLIALGAILAFAVHVSVGWLSLNVVGYVLMIAGVVGLLLTIWFWQQRRARHRPTLVEETQLMHHPTGPVPPEPPDAHLPAEPPA